MGRDLEYAQRVREMADEAIGHLEKCLAAAASLTIASEPFEELMKVLLYHRWTAEQRIARLEADAGGEAAKA